MNHLLLSPWLYLYLSLAISGLIGSAFGYMAYVVDGSLKAFWKGYFKTVVFLWWTTFFSLFLLSELMLLIVKEFLR